MFFPLTCCNCPWAPTCPNSTLGVLVAEQRQVPGPCSLRTSGLPPRPSILPGPGASTHRIEVLNAGGFKRPRHGLGCGHAGYRVAIANGLAHGDNVGDKVFPLQLEGPEVLAHSAKAHLNLVCDKDPSGPADVPAVEDRGLTGAELWPEGSEQEQGGLGTESWLCQR